MRLALIFDGRIFEWSAKSTLFDDRVVQLYRLHCIKTDPHEIATRQQYSVSLTYALFKPDIRNYCSCRVWFHPPEEHQDKRFFKSICSLRYIDWPGGGPLSGDNVRYVTFHLRKCIESPGTFFVLWCLCGKENATIFVAANPIRCGSLRDSLSLSCSAFP